jgi:hypothetical protein
MPLYLQEDFVKTLPGMERKINEHLVGFSFPPILQCGSGGPGSRASNSLAAGGPNSGPVGVDLSAQEVPLLKGSFGHHMANCSSVGSQSQDSIYGLERSGGGTNSRMMMINSESANSVIGLTSTSTSQCHTETIPVTAEIAPHRRSSAIIEGDQQHQMQQQQQQHHQQQFSPRQHQPLPQRQQTFNYINVADDEVHPHHHHHHVMASSGNHPTHSMTLPRSIDFYGQQQQQQPPVSMSNAIKRGSYIGPTAVPVSQPVVPPMSVQSVPSPLQQMPPMSANGSMLNGNGCDIASDSSSYTFAELNPMTNGGRELTVVTSPPSRAALATATMPRNGSLMSNGKKKKSVTIGPTFTTVDEHNGYDDAGNNYTSAV